MHLEAANIARIVHLHQRVKDYYDRKNYDEVVNWSTAHPENRDIVITTSYKIPPHLAWQVIVCFRFLSYIESENLLVQFRDQYQEYSQYIYNSANSSKAWYGANWPDVQSTLEKILSFALQQFIVAADKSSSPDEKIQYLSYITLHYNYSKEWYELLSNDDLKFYAAFTYHSLGKTAECKSFLQHIADLAAFIRKKQTRDFTGQALAMLEDIDTHQHRIFLTEAMRGNLLIDDTMILSSILNLLHKAKYHEANEIIQNNRYFRGQPTAIAACIYHTSGKTKILESLEALVKENEIDKCLSYWSLLHDIIITCINSMKYSPKRLVQSDQRAILYGLLKISADRIQAFPISFELKTKIGHMVNEAMDFLRSTLSSYMSSTQIDLKINQLIDKGHKCMRGERGFSLTFEIESIIKGISYAYESGEIIEYYLPLNVSEDHDCAFHVLNTSRKDGMDLLLQHVKTQNVVSKALFGNRQRKDIITILLDDLEVKNNTEYDRSEQNFSTNVDLVTKYLEDLSKSDTWMPYNQEGCSVLDALACLLEKNLRVFVTSTTGQLVLTSSNIHDETFQTVDMLCTSTSGFCFEQSKFNHYIKLIKLPAQVIEMVDRPVSQQDNNPALLFSASNTTCKRRNVPPQEAGHQQVCERHNRLKLV
jgi:hypothetical protein